MSDDADEWLIEPPVVVESFARAGREGAEGDPAGRCERARRGAREPGERTVRGFRRIGRGWPGQ